MTGRTSPDRMWAAGRIKKKEKPNQRGSVNCYDSQRQSRRRMARGPFDVRNQLFIKGTGMAMATNGTNQGLGRMRDKR